MIWKNWFPVGGLTVTESAAEPAFVMVNDLFSLSGAFSRGKFRMVFDSLSLLTPPPEWASTAT